MANSLSRRNAINGASASFAATALSLPALASISSEGPMDRQIIRRIAAVRLAIAKLDDAGIPHSEAEDVAMNEGDGFTCLIADITRLASKGERPTA